MDRLTDLLDGFGGNLRSLLPLLLIGMLLVGHAMLVVTRLLPNWNTYSRVSTELDQEKTTLEAVLTAQAPDDTEVIVLQRQVDTALSSLEQAATAYLTESDADHFVEHLYRYARASQIEITNLQAVQAPTAPDNGAYDARAFRMQAEGTVEQLQAFVIGLKDLTVPSIVFSDLSVAQDDEAAALTLSMTIYASQLAAADVLPELPEAEAAIDVPTPVPAAVETLATPAAAAEAPVIVECPGTQPSPFRAGDTAVVRFQAVGALRILDQPSGLDVLTQVYDGAQLHLLEGPVCGTWHDENIYYWYIEIGDVRGWAGEGDSEDRWMCPVDDPQCS